MTTENQNQEVNQEQHREQEVKLSPIEQKALEQGWRPKDQFEGAEEDFIDAAEFVRRGELFSKIEKQSREVKQLREALEALKVHHSKVRESEYNRALKAVEAERRKAFEAGDTDKFFELEGQMDLIKEEKALVEQEAKKPVAPQVPPALEAWMDTNTWYQKDRAMTAFVDQMGRELHARGYPLEQALKEIDAEVRKEFPHKFERKRPPSPEGSSRSGNTSNKESYSLSEDERTIMRKIVSSGAMTEAEYIKELKRVKGV
jgi:hypothetical protein